MDNSLGGVDMENNQPQGLPSTMVLLAYLAAGSALSCSWLMLRQVLDQRAAGLTGGEVIGWLLPTAILFGAAILARMCGHLATRKTASVGLALVACSWLYLEGISIYTSFISVNVSLETQAAAERDNTVMAQSSNRSQEAVSRAISELTTSMEAMPANWITRRQQASEQLSGLIDQQQALAAISQSQTTAMMSAFDGQQKQWSLLIAVALSVIVLGVQFGLGLTSDGAQRDRRGFLDDFLCGGGYDPAKADIEALPEKKQRGLSIVR